MAQEHPAWVAHQRRRFMRPDAYRWVRPDAHRWLPPGTRRRYGEDVIHYFVPEVSPASQVEARERDDDCRIAARIEERAEQERRTEILRLRSNIAALRFQLVLIKSAQVLLGKANFNPNQPRVPAGDPRGGQWTDMGGIGREVISDAIDDPLRPGAQYARRAPPRPGIGHNRPPPGKLPEIPKQRPPTSEERTSILTQLALSAMTLRAILEGPKWIREYLADIQSYRDPPKSIEKLYQEADDLPKPGYQRHHIVEQTSAEQDGFSRRRIDASENLVAVPRLKHQEISAWYSRINNDEPFNGLTPRDYLRGKSWAQRRKIGLEALIEFGVLKR